MIFKVAFSPKFNYSPSVIKHGLTALYYEGYQGKDSSCPPNAAIIL